MSTSSSAERIGASAFVAPLAVAIIWGVNVPVMKAGLEELDPFLFNAARLTLSAVALAIMVAFEPKQRTPLPWARIVPFALLSSVLYQVLFLWGIDSTSASNTALLVATGPLWTALLSRMAGLERFTRAGSVGLALAFGGALLVTATGSRGGGSLDGDLAILVAMILWAYATVLSRPMLEQVSATRLAFLATVIAVPFHWVIARLLGDEPAPLAAIRDLNTFGIFALAYSGALSTGVAYALWNRSVVRLGPAGTAAFSYLVPVVALLVAWHFLGDRPRIEQLVGGGLVLAGLAWRERARLSAAARARARARAQAEAQDRD